MRRGEGPLGAVEDLPSPVERSFGAPKNLVLEATMVVEGRAGAEAGRQLDVFLQEAEIELSPVTPE
ncbi:MAG: type II toxin-antitoxin system VapC family toxin, partial [Acidobacteria bacterium]|nr:type II toxin-antitoxin system VapC family toxin [Acidobacteriota bacterium]